jgi:hypothetical protein
LGKLSMAQGFAVAVMGATSSRLNYFGNVLSPKLHCRLALGQVLGPHVDRGDPLHDCRMAEAAIDYFRLGSQPLQPRRHRVGCRHRFRGGFRDRFMGGSDATGTHMSSQACSGVGSDLAGSGSGLLQLPPVGGFCNGQRAFLTAARLMISAMLRLLTCGFAGPARRPAEGSG